jgi:predicted Zn-dependent protease
VDDDRELGRVADDKVMSTARPYVDADLRAYVDGVLAKVARHARPTASRWSLRLLDTSEISVRSGPGGYVYVTRGLLACLGSEAELAAALAHEVAHVSKRHWRKQAEYLIRHGVEDGDIGKLQPDHRAELLSTLRREELEADALALDYLKAAGYEGSGLTRVIALFAQIERLAGGARAPEHLRTHPNTAARLAAVHQRTAPGGRRFESEYLARIDGLQFGEDARDGYLFGDRYVVPRADFELVLPAAWRAQLVGRDLMAALPGRGTVALVARSEHGDLQATLSALGGGFAPTTLGELRAFVAKGERAGGMVSSSWVIDTGSAPLVLAVVAPRGEEESEPVRALVAGARRISSPALRNIGTLRIRLQKLAQQRTLREVFTERPPRTNLVTFSLINGVGPDEPLDAGRVIKRVEP